MVVVAPPKETLIEQIQALVPPGAPEPRDPYLLAELTALTSELIRVYKAEGHLETDPLSSMWERRISLYERELQAGLKDQIVLVTGGAGCVGQSLLNALRQFKIKKIISVDLVCQESERGTPSTGAHFPQETHYRADVRDLEQMERVFAAEQPTIVFHLAAQRRPDLAEVQIHDTITTNVFGTETLISLCERYRVRHCIYASTGKCFNYVTANVYAASKKLAEFQVARAAQTSGYTVYSIVRFTHILDNSLVNCEINQGLAQGVVKLHSAERYMNVQNVHEAAQLLLNALALAKADRRSRFLTVRNIGWPVNTLEIALYRIDRSGRDIPLYFLGVPQGYDVQFFKGQFDWSGENELHPLINALESPSTSEDASGSMLISEIAPFSNDVLAAALAWLHARLGQNSISEAQSKEALIEALQGVVVSVFQCAPTSRLMRILNWGVDFEAIEANYGDLYRHRDVITLLLRELIVRCEGEKPPQMVELLRLLSLPQPAEARCERSALTIPAI